MYYDRQCKSISIVEWATKFNDPSYQIIKQEELPDGKFLSTVWLGADHGVTTLRPLIFETMLFPSKDGGLEIDGMRYTTEEEALAGHNAILNKALDNIIYGEVEDA